MNGPVRKRRWRSGDRGAVAIEFVLILPILILLVFGIYGFGRAYNAKVTLTHAAREAVREFVISEDVGAAQLAGENAAPALDPAQLDVDIDDLCDGGQDPDTATAVASYSLSIDIPLWGSPTFDFEEEAVMRCGG